MADDDSKRPQNGDTDKGKDDENKDVSRRSFLKNTGIAAGGVVGGALLGGGIVGYPFNKEEEDKETKKPVVDYTQARQFFRREEEFKVLGAATERIFPEDDNGPGAIELGVPYFIDRQLAGRWGVNAREYRYGPFHEGEPNQGYQNRLNRQEVFQIGVRTIQDYSEKEYDEKFPDLDEDEQDEIVKALEDDDIEMDGIPSSEFFDMLRTSTLEGVYADPSYGGNKNMAGWKMKEYPGVQLSFNKEIEDEDFVKKEPKALTDYE